MKMVKDHIEYLKDNPEGYWFKCKLYGYGWTPAKKEGWLTIVVYIAFVLGVVWFGDSSVTESQIVKHVIVPVVAATVLLLVICWRTGEPLKWHWGNKQSKS